MSVRPSTLPVDAAGDGRTVCGLAVADHLALAHLVHGYWLRHDRIEPGCPSDFYLPDARMTVGRTTWENRDRIAAWYIGRRRQEDASGRRTRHLVSNLTITAMPDDRAALRFMATVFAGAGAMPFAAGPPVTLADFTAVCARQGDGTWLFEALRAHIAFNSPEAAPHTQ